MRRFTFLLFVALLTFLIVLWIKRPDIVSNFWLWVVGLAAPVIGLFKKIKQEISESEYFKNLFHSK
jgi:hypothetical protein